MDRFRDLCAELQQRGGTGLTIWTKRDEPRAMTLVWAKIAINGTEREGAKIMVWDKDVPRGNYDKVADFVWRKNADALGLLLDALEEAPLP
jgi:hypothetical protein